MNGIHLGERIQKQKQAGKQPFPLGFLIFFFWKFAKNHLFFFTVTFTAKLPM